MAIVSGLLLITTFNALPASVSFASAVNYSTGTGPRAVAISDFNGDLRPDLAVTSSSSGNNISILLGNTDGTFTAGTPVAAGNSPVHVAVGDFNLDGRQDIVAVNNGSANVSIFLGNGNGTFAAAANYTTGSGTLPVSVAVADFDGNFRPDLVVASNVGSPNGTVVVLLNTGGGVFGAPGPNAAGDGPRSVGVGDFNHDGFKDIAVCNQWSDNVSVLLGNGNGTFGIPSHVSVGLPGVKPYSLAVADLNNDLDDDIAVALFGDVNVGILIGIGDGTFQPVSPYSAGSTSCPKSVTVGEFNGDGIWDIAAASECGFAVSVLLGVGNGSFGSPTTLSGGTTPVYLANSEFNRDGRRDLVVVNAGGNNISVYLNTTALPSESFGAAANLAIGTTDNSIAVADFDRNGPYDFVVANGTDNKVRVRLGTGTGGFTIPPTSEYTVGNNAVAVTVGDFDGDFDADIVCANNGSANVSVLLNNGSGVFAASVPYAAGTGPRSVTVGDFNRDDKVDLAVANSGANKVNILLGTGNGMFGAAVPYSAGATPWFVAVGDLNNDGFLDLAVANSVGNNVSILLGNGAGVFTLLGNYAAGTTPRSIAMGDFDRDRDLDLAVANGGSGNVSILLNTGTGAFASPVNYVSGSQPYSVAVGDFNGDARLDLAIAALSSSNVRIFKGTGSGSFISPTLTFATASSPASVAPASLNGDSLADLVVACQSGNVSTLLNQATVAPLLTRLGMEANKNLTRLPDNHVEGAVAINPANPENIVSFCFNADVLEPEGGLIRSYSRNGGRTWTTGAIADGTDMLPVACCDPTCAFDHFGNLYLAYIKQFLHQDVIIARSTDGGANFTVIQTFSGNTGPWTLKVDQPTIATGPHTVVGQASIWVTFVDFSLTPQGSIVASGAVSTGLGNIGVFSTPPQMAADSDDYNFGDVAIGPNGQIMVTGQKVTIDQLPEPIPDVYVWVDTNGVGGSGFGGRILVTSTRVDGFDTIPAQPHRDVTAEAGLAWDRSGGPRHGRVYIVYTDESPDESDNQNVFMRFSDNNGTTWSAPIQVNDDDTRMSKFFPRISLDQTTGNIAISWHDCSNDDPSNVRTRFFTTLSRDGGRSFFANAQISVGTSDISQLTESPLDYGDYTGLSFFGGIFFPVWADNSNSTGDNPDGNARFDLYTSKVRAWY